MPSCKLELSDCRGTMDKLTLLCTFLFLISLTLPRGQAVLHNPPNSCEPTPRKSNNGLAGAAYFMTDDPNGNSIVINSIYPDGSLKFSHTIPTNGNGSYSLLPNLPNGTPIPDPLVSQDSVLVAEKYLFAVNAGSNTVSMFCINQANPLILRFVSTGNTGGDFPVALTFSKRLQMLCVANGGTRNGVQCFSVDRNHGLTVLPNTARSLTNQLNQTTPPTGPFTTVTDILFVQDSTQLLIAVTGNPLTSIQGFIASFAVNGRTLAKNPVINKPPGSIAPFSISIIPGTYEKAVIFTDPVVGYGVVDFNGGTESSAVIVPIPAQQVTCWSACSTRLNRCYVVDPATSNITETSFSQAGGKTSSQIIKQYAATGIIIDSRIVTLYTSRRQVREFMYILSPSIGGIQVLALKGPGDAELAHSVPLAADVLSKCGITLSIAIQGMAVFVI